MTFNDGWIWSDVGQMAMVNVMAGTKNKDQLQQRTAMVCEAKQSPTYLVAQENRYDSPHNLQLAELTQDQDGLWPNMARDCDVCQAYYLFAMKCSKGFSIPVNFDNFWCG